MKFQRGQNLFRRIFKKIIKKPILIAFLLISLIVTVDIFLVTNNWRHATGSEIEWIADALVKDQGFSFDSKHRWLFSEKTASDLYFPTAWKEPVAPFVLAICFKVFGAYGRLVFIILQICSLFGSLVVIYKLSLKIFGVSSGWIAVALLVFLPRVHLRITGQLGEYAFAAFLLSFSALLLLECIENTSIRRGISLGFVLGLTCLTQAGAMLLIPLSAILIILSKGLSRSIKWKTAGIAIFAAVFVISPWTLRNYIVFSEFIPIRTGFGIIVNVGNPIISQTFQSDLSLNKQFTPPPWIAENASDSFYQMKVSQQKVRDLFSHAKRIVELNSPKDYHNLNEAQRDRIYFKHALGFMISHPLTTIKLTFLKLNEYFFNRWKEDAGILALFCLLGIMKILRNHKARVILVIVLVFSIAPIISFPLYYRYRLACDPLIAVIAASVITPFAEKLWHYFTADEEMDVQ